MAIQVSGTQVISNARALTNIASIDSTTAAAITAAGVGGSADAFQVLTTAPSNPSVGDCYYNSSDSHLYVYDGTDWGDLDFSSIQLNTVSGEQIFTNTSGNWTVPAGVYKISVVCVGAGATASSGYDAGHGGGALCWKNIDVTPNQSFSYNAPAGSSSNTTATTFVGNGVSMSAGAGGKSNGQSVVGTGGFASGGDDGGNHNGGNGGRGYASGSYGGGGGGGAAGYSGVGGTGGNGNGSSATSGSNGQGGGGGGGGGGYDSRVGQGYVYSGSGGGVGLYGEGASGIGGYASGNYSSAGSGGNGSVTASTTHYGRGDSGGYFRNNTGGSSINGAIRIVWKTGSINAFPSSNVD